MDLLIAERNPALPTFPKSGQITSHHLLLHSLIHRHGEEFIFLSFLCKADLTLPFPLLHLYVIVSLCSLLIYEVTTDSFLQAREF